MLARASLLVPLPLVQGVQQPVLEIQRGTTDPAMVFEMIDALARPYPVGLSVEGLGAVVVNDVFASSDMLLWNLTDRAVRFLLDALPPR